ncbi:MAG TPA: sensor histidine kinase [Solirubrobacterales bacterium]
MERLPFQHQALIYEGADDYLGGTMPFLRAALEAGKPTMVAVGQVQAELLLAELGGDAARIRFVDMWEAGRNPAAIIPLWREFVDEYQGREVCGIGEPVWADRSPAALEECHRHEALLNVAFASPPAWQLLCPYDACSLDQETIAKVAYSHRQIHWRGGVEESPAFEADPDCIAGELPPPPAPADMLTFGLGELGVVRRLVVAEAERAGIGRSGVADLVTAASELAANSVIHGGGSGTLRMWRGDGSLLVEIEDDGRIEDPLVGRLRPTVSQEGGRGLWIANQLCDLVQIRSGAAGTKVRLHVPAPGVTDYDQTDAALQNQSPGSAARLARRPDRGRAGPCGYRSTR